MSQPSGDQEVTIADIVIDDLSKQIANLSRDLAVKRARVVQLEAFIRSNAEVLGLTEESPDVEPAPLAKPRSSRANGQTPDKVSAKG